MVCTFLKGRVTLFIFEEDLLQNKSYYKYLVGKAKFG